MLKEVFIDIVSPRLEYHFSLKHNISILIGDSATGKSLIINLLRRIKSRDDRREYVNSTLPVIELNEEFLTMASSVDNLGSTIFIIDEDSKFLGRSEFRDFIFKSGAYFLIICREIDIIEESIDINAIYRIHGNKKNGKTINTFITAYSSFIDNKYLEFPLYTEDTKSGKILCEHFGYHVEKGLGGNGNVKVFLSKLSDRKASLFTDLVAFGQIMPYFKKASENNSLNLLDCKSTEYILLKNKMLFSSLEPDELVWDFKKYKSLEKVYTHLLKVATKRVFGKQYNKGEDIIKLIDTNVKKEIKRIFEGEETKSVQSKKLADLL